MPGAGVLPEDGVADMVVAGDARRGADAEPDAVLLGDDVLDHGPGHLGEADPGAPGGDGEVPDGDVRDGLALRGGGAPGDEDPDRAVRAGARDAVAHAVEDDVGAVDQHADRRVGGQVVVQGVQSGPVDDERGRVGQGLHADGEQAERQQQDCRRRKGAGGAPGMDV